MIPSLISLKNQTNQRNNLLNPTQWIWWTLLTMTFWKNFYVRIWKTLCSSGTSATLTTTFALSTRTLQSLIRNGQSWHGCWTKNNGKTSILIIGFGTMKFSPSILGGFSTPIFGKQHPYRIRRNWTQFPALTPLSQVVREEVWSLPSAPSGGLANQLQTQGALSSI